MNIADNIRSLRKNRGYSQIRLAGLLAVDKHTVGAWERGTQRPGSKSDYALTRMFAV